MSSLPDKQEPWSDVRYTHGVSEESPELIRLNECEARDGLATSRFRALWNEIQRLRLAYTEAREGEDAARRYMLEVIAHRAAAPSARGDIAVQPWALAILVHIAQLQRNNRALSAAAHAALEHAEQLMAATDGKADG